MLRIAAMLLVVPAVLAAQSGAAPSRTQGKADGEVTKAAVTQEHREAAQQALGNAGRANAASADIDQAATAIARGYAPAQIEALAKAAPADRPLAVALEVLVKLADQGVAQDQAIARVQAKLEAKEADDAINALAVPAAPEGTKKP